MYSYTLFIIKLSSSRSLPVGSSTTSRYLFLMRDAPINLCSVVALKVYMRYIYMYVHIYTQYSYIVKT